MIEVDKIDAYANALDSDITAESFKQVRDGKLWRGFIGTIYGCGVGTESGTVFNTRREAWTNAVKFRERCREIQRKQSNAQGKRPLDQMESKTSLRPEGMGSGAGALEG